MSSAIAALRTRFPQQYGPLSSDPSHYTVAEINFNPEVSTVGSAGEISLSVKNIGVHTAPTPPAPSPTPTVAHHFFDNRPLGSTFEQVAAFDPNLDEVMLSHRVFTALKSQGYFLAPAMLHVGPGFTNSAQRIDYNPANGLLTYDANGSGPGGHATHFMTLPAHLDLHYYNFVIVA
jgi:hypothetical protein